MNRCFESVAKFRIGEWNVRIWRTEAIENDCDNSDIVKWAEELTHMVVMNDYAPTRAFLLKRGAEFERVSAIEVTDDEGMGALVYPDWK